MRADQILSFDEASAVLCAQAGLSLGRLADLYLHHGFFVPVTPGTREVTLGGMVAADVHGKNHHVAGTIGDYVRSLRMRLADGSIQEVSETSAPEIFRATLGGMGLTGHILEVTLEMERVPSRSVFEESCTYPDLESLIHELLAAGEIWPFTVAWSDLLARGGSCGRGVLLCGRWAEAGEIPSDARSSAWPRLAVPCPMPASLLTDVAVSAFNALRYQAARRGSSGSNGHSSAQVRSADSFFYPLDAMRDWNLLYGRRGFTQYQCVLPRDVSMRSYRRLVEIARSGGPGPFLTVIKDCGAQGKGMLSFPMPGISFAMDFPIHEGTPALVARLNDHVAACGGRIYLAKDAFTTAEQFAAMERRRLPAFLALRERIDPEKRISSALAVRLFGD